MDFTFRFESDEPLLVEVLERCYRDLPVVHEAAGTIRAVSGGSGDRYDVSYVDPAGEVVECEQSVSSAGVLDVITWEVNHRATLSRRDAVTLHAAVTAGPLGAVAMCGQTQSGKSTLAAAAAQRGWRHLSDDLAPIDVASMSVHPYARPVMIRPGGRRVLADLPEPPLAHRPFFTDDWFFPASELGAATVDDPVPLVAVVMLSWGDIAELEPISKASTLFGLISASTSIGRRGEVEFGELERIAVAVPGYRLALGEPGAALDLLAPLIGAS